MNLYTQVAEARSSIARISQQVEFENKRIESIQARLRAIEADKTKLVKVVALIDKVIAALSANGIGRIEATVTNGLKLVFEQQDIAFKVVKKEGARGNSYSLEAVQGEVHGDIFETFGNSVANVVSFLLRVIMIKRFNLAKIIIADESFSNIANEQLPAMSRLLNTLVEDGGYTIIAVTHQPILASAAKTVYHVVAGVNDAPPSLHRLTGAEMAELKE